MLRFGDKMKILLRFTLAFALIFLRSSNEREFLLKSKLDVGFLLRFLLRSGDFRSNLSLMLWFFFDFCLDPMIFA